MKHTIRFIILFFALVMAGAGNVWAISESDIIFNIQPNSSAGTVTDVTVSGMTVTFTANPATGYNIDANHIIAEKMVDALAPRRAPGIASELEVTGSGNSYSFIIPEGYTGAYVTVNFYQDAPEGFTQITSLSEISNLSGKYQLTADVSGVSSSLLGGGEFTGTLDGGLHKIIGSSKPLFTSTNGAIIRNIIFEDVNISSGDDDGDAGAITCKAKGNTRIYNCGILPTSTERDNDGNITGFSGSTVSGSGNVGGLVGKLSGTARVINCYSYANITGGTNVAGIVGNNSVTTTMSSINTMVMNCMFYGNITGASTMKPVYGGQVISNAGVNGVNNYNYYRNGKDVTFDDNYANFAAYYCTLPAEEEYLTRFEYYRSILNSNKRLCTYWITDKVYGSANNAPTDEDEALVAKWVLDPSIAPYPILKKWGKYPSVINQDPEYVWNPKTQQKVSRTSAEPYQGKRLGTISVTVNAGAKHAGTGNTSVTLPSVIVMDMDTLNHDYGYAKIQLPYYNEVFGDPTANADTQWDKRYAGNYKDYVVTGWKITGVSGGNPGSFKGYAVTSVPDATSSVSAGTVTPDDTSGNPWEDGFNFADRNCTNKDKYSKSGRVFAQGGYYYVPEGVTSITIEAYWGKAVYLHNSEHSIDRVNVAAQASNDGSGDTTGPDFGSAFTPAGTLATTFQTYEVKTNLQDAIAALTNNASYTVYDQAIVLVGNVQVKNRGGSLNNGSRAFTIMSCDLDMDNEPDYCLQFQQRNTTNRPAINPVRFDFLPVPELGLAIRTNTFAYTIGLMVPKGHFEITETSFMHTTQFEYDATGINKTEAPLILNGGHFEQIVERTGNKDKTSYILMGGNFRIKRFTPGYHATPQNSAPRHCAVNAIGGEYPEFYLSGIYAPDQATRDNDNPHCYTNGGYFGFMAGAGYEQVKGDVTFKIDHSIIREFYGGGINAAKPVTGNIDVEINNSLVDKYCGGPKVGSMEYVENNVKKYKTVTTKATGTTFGVFYGGGNGGTSYYRERKLDNTGAFRTTAANWEGYSAFNPLNQVSGIAAAYKDETNAKWGYHAEYEFEVFNSSNGLKSKEDVIRVYYRWAQFGTTTTGNISNKLTNCTVKGNFYGGGNLATVTGNVESYLKGDTHVYGSAFGGGYSASIPSFSVHDKTTVKIPSKDNSGNVDEQGSLDYYKDNGKNRMYTWCYKNSTTGKIYPSEVNEIPDNVNKDNPTFMLNDKWYCYTTVSLEDLGMVSGTVTLNIEDNTTVDGSVYGGGEESGVDGSTEVEVTGGTIGTKKEDGTYLGGADYGNVYGGGKGKNDNVTAGLVKGTATVTISGTPTIYHNVYGGGAYGSVGDFIYDNTTGLPTARKENTTGGVCTVTITGGTIGTTGKENGMVFGSSRGDVGQPGGITDKQAWVHQTQVTIGDAALETGPTIKGSVYGGGENGHTFTNAVVEIKKGTVGITDTQTDGGARYPYRGNVYGGGCGTDTYTVKENAGTESEKTYTYFNRLAGIVRGNTEVNITGGHVVHNVYGGGAMGSVGVFTREASDNIHVPGKITGITSGGKCTVTVSGGKVGNTGAKMINETGGPDDFGHVFGGARGEVHDLADYPNLERVVYVDNTEVTISDGLVTGSVYGGSESGHVRGNTNVTVSGGQIGCGDGASSAYTTWDSSVKPTTHWTYEANGKPYDQYASETGTYDYTNFPNILEADRRSTSEGGRPTATDGHTFYGNVFGGGSGYYPYAPGYWLRSAGQVGGTATVTISGGHILNNVYGGCEMADVEGAVTVTMTGGTVGVPRTKEQIEALPTLGHIYGAGMGDKRIFFNTSTNVASTTVSVTGGTVYGSVYGGGEDGHVLGNAVTTISKEAGEEKVAPVIGCDGKSGYDGNVFGGGQGSSTALTAGVVGGNVTLDILDGTINGSVYGGGQIGSIGTYFAMAKIDDPEHPGQEIDNPLYGKMQEDDGHGCIAVNLTGGTIEQNVYGGCMGTTEDPALGVSKNIVVNLNGTAEDNVVADNARGCVVKGSIFGCNNVNSSPEGTVVVHVYGTQHAGKSQIANTAATNETVAVTDAKTKDSYDVTAVYGGGNMAAYVPKDLTTGTTNVIIDGCGRTSIKQVYGGGNAASTPATNLTINGTFEIDEVFGGGNGKDNVVKDGVTKPNPGANVGYKDYSEYYQDDNNVWKVKDKEDADTKEKRLASDYQYGTGKASVNIFGGTIHRVFGGSNTKGNVRQTAVTMLEEAGGCDFCVDEAYGGGKSAPMDAEAKLLMACIPGLQAAYGGAEAADIQGNVTLNITNGTFERVFGGNNKSGTISGAIKVNVSEIGCKPIIIGELYGGGNLAAYSIYGYHEKKDANNQVVTDDSGNTVWEVNQTKVTNGPEFDSPEVNVMSFTSIGTIYGGGYGTPAVMVGSPTVNVSVAEGAWKDYVGESTHYEDDGYMYNSNGYKGETLTITDENGSHNVVLPSHNKGKIGAINNVFGGGNAAKVIGNTNVKIGTLSKVKVRSYVEKKVNVGASVEGLYTRSGAGTVASPYKYTETGASDVAEDGVTYYVEKDVDKDVIGADIRGNVYGGGNEAEVTGNTNVQIGKKNE